MSINDYNCNNFINGNGYCQCLSNPCRCCLGPTGPEGARGATGATGAVGPTGSAGAPGMDGLSPYIGANGDWYIGNVDTLVHAEGPTGPTGPTGAAGATILDSYETFAELIAAHPSGTAGDAYLAGGVLYVWDAEAGEWKDMGSIVGPTGAAGVTILDSYETFAELIAAHPSGTAGDAYLAEGVLYVWDAETGEWKDMGSIVGPEGPAGPEGPRGADGVIGEISGIVPEIADLPQTGIEQGTIYYVEEDSGIYVWDDTAGGWVKLDVAQGPRGATEPTI